MFANWPPESPVKTLLFVSFNMENLVISGNLRTFAPGIPPTALHGAIME